MRLITILNQSATVLTADITQVTATIQVESSPGMENGAALWFWTPQSAGGKQVITNMTCFAGIMPISLSHFGYPSMWYGDLDSGNSILSLTFTINNTLSISDNGDTVPVPGTGLSNHGIVIQGSSFDVMAEQEDVMMTMPLSINYEAVPSPSIHIDGVQTTRYVDSITFTASVTNAPNPTYAWYKKGSLINGATSSTYTLPIISMLDTIQAKITVNGTVYDSNIINLVVGENVSISGDWFGTQGVPQKFTAVQYHPTWAPTYKWYKNGSLLADETAETLTITPILHDKIKATVTYTQQNCPFVTYPSQEIEIQSVLVPKVDIFYDGNELNGTFIASSTGNAPLWYVNGVTSGITSMTFSPTGLQYGDVVHAVLTQGYGPQPQYTLVTPSNSITLIDPMATVTISGNTSSAPEGSFTFTATPTNLANPTYQWYASQYGNAPYPVDGETSSTLTVIAGWEQDVSYFVAAKGDNGSCFSNTLVAHILYPVLNSPTGTSGELANPGETNVITISWSDMPVGQEIYLFMTYYDVNWNAVTTALPGLLVGDASFVIENSADGVVSNTVYSLNQATGSATLTVTALDDAHNGYYSFDARYNGDSYGTVDYYVSVPPIPEMDIKQNNVSIAKDGNYSFGSTLIGDSVDVEFAIFNTGNADLTLGMVSTDDAQFTVLTQPTSPIAVGMSETFSVRFTPSSVGLKTSTLSVSNNDFDENPYTVNLSGLAIAPSVPEIDITQNGLSIATGGSAGYGTVSVGTQSDLTFLIHNTGTSALTLIGDVAMFGGNTDQFSVISQPSSPIAVGGSSPFVVRFAPTSRGLKTSSVVTTNNDSDESSYSIAVNGTALDTNVLLSDLGVGAGTLTPSFSAAQHSYTVSVGNAINSISVSAAAASPTEVTGTGSHSLSVGSNTITVTTTAENGATGSYTLTVTRAAAAQPGTVDVSGPTASLPSNTAITPSIPTTATAALVSAILLEGGSDIAQSAEDITRIQLVYRDANEKSVRIDFYKKNGAFVPVKFTLPATGSAWNLTAALVLGKNGKFKQIHASDLPDGITKQITKA